MKNENLASLPLQSMREEVKGNNARLRKLLMPVKLCEDVLQIHCSKLIKLTFSALSLDQLRKFISVSNDASASNHVTHLNEMIG